MWWSCVQILSPTLLYAPSCRRVFQQNLIILWSYQCLICKATLRLFLSSLIRGHSKITSPGWGGMEWPKLNFKINSFPTCIIRFCSTFRLGRKFNSKTIGFWCFLDPRRERPMISGVPVSWLVLRIIHNLFERIFLVIKLQNGPFRKVIMLKVKFEDLQKNYDFTWSSMFKVIQGMSSWSVCVV